jgi:hypothetical protein
MVQEPPKNPETFPSHKKRWLGTYMGSQPHSLKYLELLTYWVFFSD